MWPARNQREEPASPTKRFSEREYPWNQVSAETDVTCHTYQDVKDAFSPNRGGNDFSHSLRRLANELGPQVEKCRVAAVGHEDCREAGDPVRAWGRRHQLYIVLLHD